MQGDRNLRREGEELNMARRHLDDANQKANVLSGSAVPGQPQWQRSRLSQARSFSAPLCAL